MIYFFEKTFIYRDQHFFFINLNTTKQLMRLFDNFKNLT